MIVGLRFDVSWALGTRSSGSGFAGTHCQAPAGLFVRSQSYLYSSSRYRLSQRVGVLVQAPSNPLTIVSSPLPVPQLFFQPRFWSSMEAPSTSGPRQSAGTAPWVL